MKLAAVLSLGLVLMSCSDESKFASSPLSAELNPEVMGDVDSEEPKYYPYPLPTPEPVTYTPAVQAEEIAVVGLGINFEDQVYGQSDQDYNDVALCFEGQFSLEDKKITALEDQLIIAKAETFSDCKHNVHLTIRHEDGSVSYETAFKSKADANLSMTFMKGDTLEIEMRPIAGGGCDSSFTRTMNDNRYAQITKNICLAKKTNSGE